MSKKPKQSRHRVPVDYVRPPEPVSERYQAEIDSSVSRLTRKYERAQKRLAATEARRDRLAALPSTKAHELRSLELAIEQRRAELREIERLMMPGDYVRVGHRPVPTVVSS